jgi:hypothetical protein
MILGTTLASVEKKFGPALAGTGPADRTFSAIRTGSGKGKKFAGVAGQREDAVFYLHFPLPIDWSQLASKKGTPDFINNLSATGPQGEQGRKALVEEFLTKYSQDEEARKAKAEAKEKKRVADQRKEETRSIREKLSRFAGELTVAIEIGGERLKVPVTIKMDKSGKVKLFGTY